MGVKNSPLLQKVRGTRVSRWLPGLLLLASLAITYGLWKYERAEEFERVGLELKLVKAANPLPALESMQFNQGPFAFALYGAAISVLLSVFSWLILRSRERVISMAVACRENEQRWKLALEGAGDGVWDWNVATGEVMYSLRMKEMLGYANDEIGNSLDEWKKRIHPEDVERVARDIDDYFNGKTPSYINEHRLQCKDGKYKWVLNRGTAVGRDQHGKPLRMVGTAIDITEARQSEQDRLIQMARQRDVLVREVHHRIKNNLQGVVGLLRQHAGKDVQVRRIIEQAIAHVQTVAVVHGLQGQASGNEVVLCEMVPAIARTAGAMLQPSPDFDIRVDVPQRIRVFEQETVPIALILNELIMNAAKHAHGHSGSAHIGISVTWDHPQTLARICIVNPGMLPQAFDFTSGTGIGTGLELVRSLLPPNGGRLLFDHGNGQVKAVLELSEPSIFNV